MKPKLRIEPAPAADRAPLNAAEFAGLMEGLAPFAAPLHLAIGVSGGPDSMALAFCARRWLDGQKTGGALIAFIVDHGLREGSAAEAEQTQKTLLKIGIEFAILRWDHPPITARLHEAARKARLQLLTETCRQRGIVDLMLAHQREDQAETILMRLAKGSGIDGLAGMSARKTRDGVRILRPFLSVPKERLAATCAEAGLPFISDPSNTAQKFARGRLRRMLPLLDAEGLTIERLIDLGARAAEAKAALGHATSLLVRVATRRDEAGVIHLDLEHLRAAPRAIAERALVLCLQAVQPQDYAPAHASLASLGTTLLADAAMTPRTLHGCLISKNKSHASIMREYAAIEEARPLKPGESTLWDRRWRVTLDSGAPANLEIRALGNPHCKILDRLAPGLRRQIPQGRARASLPALWLNGALALMPVLPQSAGSTGAKATLITGWPPWGGC